MQMTNLNQDKKVGLVDLCKQQDLFEKLNNLKDDASEGEGVVKENLYGFDMELRVKRGIFLNDGDRGFTQVVHKQTKNTQPFVVAKYLEAEKQKKDFTSKTTLELPDGITLMNAINKINTWLKDRFGVDPDFLGKIRKGSAAQGVQEQNPELATLSFGEYFTKAAKRARLKKIFQKVTKANILMHRNSKIMGKKSTLGESVIGGMVSPPNGAQTRDSQSPASKKESPRNVNFNVEVIKDNSNENSKANLYHTNTQESPTSQAKRRTKFADTGQNFNLYGCQPNSAQNSDDEDFGYGENEDWIGRLIKRHDFDILHIINVAEIYDMVDRMFKFGQQELRLNHKTYDSFIRKVQKLYNQRSNPYHNFKHGVSVMQGVYFFTKFTTFKPTNLQKLALLFSALMHDIDHTGKSNTFEGNSMSSLAIRYNDRSILENHHCATAFEVLADPKTNILEDMTCRQKHTEFRKIVIGSILATDVKHHFDSLGKFKSKLDNNELNPNFEQNEDDFLQLSGILVHTADLYGPTKKLENAKTWSSLVNSEFKAQQAEEQKQGIPETPWYKGLDDMATVSKSEKFFVDKIVTPLWVELDRFQNGGLKDHRENLKKTQSYWEEMADKYCGTS